METPTETRKTTTPSNKVVIIAATLIVVTVIIAAVFIVRSGRGDSSSGNIIKYASDAKVLLDQDSVQAAMDAAMANARDGNIALRYQNDAYSEDGINFSCYIANSVANRYDMFLTIFADAELTDQLYVSGLVPPGSGFESITLERALENGTHRLYIALTQVDTDEDGNQVICQQVVHTMDFYVVKE